MQPTAPQEAVGEPLSRWPAYAITFNDAATRRLLPFSLVPEVREIVAAARTNLRSPTCLGPPKNTAVATQRAAARRRAPGPLCSLVPEAVGTDRGRDHKNVLLIDHVGVLLNYKSPFLFHVLDLAIIRLQLPGAVVKTFGLYEFQRRLFSSRSSVEAEDLPRQLQQKGGRSCAGISLKDPTST